MTKAELALYAQEILTIANEAVAKAKQENKELGLASPFSMGGSTWYELPDGTVTDEKPTPLVAA